MICISEPALALVLSIRLRIYISWIKAMSTVTEAMSPVDRAWMEMDTPQSPTVVNAVLEFSGVADVEQLIKGVLRGLLRFARFSQRPDTEVHPPVWRDCSPLDVAYHLRVYHLDEDCPAHDLRHAVAHEIAQPLDRQMPLWRMVGFVRRPGQVTLLFRAHHAMADGMALMKVLLGCADETAASASLPPQPRKGPLAALITRLEHLNAGWLRASGVLHDGLSDPQHLRERLHVGSEMLRACGRLLSLPDDNPASFRRPLNGMRAVDWSHGLPLAPLRRYAKREGFKINDVFLSALAGAFASYLLTHADESATNLRISVPVNLRAARSDHLGNQFGLILADLPLDIADPWRRLVEVSRRMQALKASPEARVTLLGLGAAGHLPVPLEKRLVELIADKSVAVVSNLPGPRRALHVAGAHLDNIVFWPPQTAHIGIGVSLFTYAGRIRVGVSADRALMPAPEALVAAFESELHALLAGPAAIG